jgi:4-deoxy-L-threo-5-hexosulose-uronate ketol-isomerase
VRTYQHTGPDDVTGLSTAALRERFLVDGLTTAPGVQLAYSHHDRLVVGGVRTSAGAPVPLPAPEQLHAGYFLERRELGVVNTGTAAATVTVDGTDYGLAPRECLYVGRGARDVGFAGDDATLALFSTRAHATFPTRHATLADAEPVRLGSVAGSNERTIYKYIHPAGIPSCELVLGVTVLEPGSMWNTMPCHLHERRTEVYFYFGLPADERVVHLMGRPEETRHLLVADQQAVISPPWSIHCGFGTHNYAFVWAMGGENQEYTDLDVVPVHDLR